MQPFNARDDGARPGSAYAYDSAEYVDANDYASCRVQQFRRVDVGGVHHGYVHGRVRVLHACVGVRDAPSGAARCQ